MNDDNKKIKTRTERDVSTLQNVSKEHLYYEYSMFIETSKALTSKNNDQFQTNILLESFVLHFRVLYDFFYPNQSTLQGKGERDDDVIATDFFTDWKATDATDMLKEQRKRADKQLAHLSYKRLNVEPEKKPWPCLEITNEIKGLMTSFVETVTNDTISEVFRTYVKNPSLVPCSNSLSDGTIL